MAVQDPEPPDPAALPPVEAASWWRALGEWHDQYDAGEQMIRRPFSSPGYHTTLTGGDVHPTRESLSYAVALLDAHDPAFLPRAEGILARVTALQDADPASPTYGVWSWFLEEPLAQMAPPDWNWADFCGVQLLQALRDHRERLSPATVPLLEAAIARAAEAIRRRDVGPHYTNIALMGAYVTLLAGQLLQRADLACDGRERLHRFFDHTAFHGSFTEYNSPAYTVVALKELWRIANHVADDLPQQEAQALYEQAWRHVARRFHLPSGQWAGPHSRAYTTLLTRATRSFLQAATEHRLRLVADEELELGIDWVRLAARCPAALRPAFTAFAGPREEHEVFWRPESGDARPPLAGVTYLTPAFTLGSVSGAELWNQRRPLVAYWGSVEQPSYLRLRCLHDSYDFAAAQIAVAQAGGDLLAGITIAPDGGDRHVSLDRLRDGTIAAGELVVRIEVGGATVALVDRWPVVWDGGPLEIDLDTLRIGIAAPWAHNALFPIRHAAGRSADLLWLDVVWHAGEPRRIALAELAASAVLAISLSDEPLAVGDADEPAQVTSDGESIHARWQRGQRTLSVDLPGRPASVEQVQTLARAAVEGT